MPTLVEKRKELDAKREALAKVYGQAGEDLDLSKVDEFKDLADGKARAERLKALHDEIDDIGQEVNSLAEAQKRYREMQEQRAKEASEKGREYKHGDHDEDGPALKGGGKRLIKSVDELIQDILDSGALDYKSIKSGHAKTGKIELPTGRHLKTLFQESAGWAPETTRTGRVVDFATRPLQVTDVFPFGTTSQTAVVYMKETVFTNAAAEVGEGLEKPEATLQYAEASDPVRKIAVILPVTDEQLDDVPGIQTRLENRLMFMVRQRLDGQLLVGDGNAPNLEGILERNNIQTQNAVDMPLIDAVRRAMTKVRVTGRATPTHVLVHPDDWTELVLTRTTDGIYIWGHPATPGPQTLWGLPVVETDILTQGEALVGDFPGYSELVIRSDMDVQVSNSHEDFFAFNKQAIRAEMRAALVVYRDEAFVHIENIGITS